MASLSGVDSNGVSQEVIDRVESWREMHDDPTYAQNQYIMLTFDIAVSQRDAEYIAECLRVLLQEQRISERMMLCLFRDGISDEAIDVFGRFLGSTSSQLQSLFLWFLPPQQVRRLLAALHTNTSVKDLVIRDLQDSEGALWIAELLRHKTDFTNFQLHNCCFPFTQIIPLLRGQPNLKILAFQNCRISNDMLLFNDPEFTQLFVENMLLSPRTILKKLWIQDCGASAHNRTLMGGIHKNTTLVELGTNHEDIATRLFIEPILRRNVYLGHVHGMLGTKTTTILPIPLTIPTPGAVDEDIVGPTTIPPPCGLWSTILAKVGQGTQGASPVFTILSDRLATWIEPSPQQQQHRTEQQQQQQQRQQQNVDNDDVSCPVPLAILQQALPECIQLGASNANYGSLGAADDATTTDISINGAEEEHHHSRHLGQKRAASKSADSTANNKIPKSSSDI